ncbi:GxxExxY protein [Kaistella daneshvariae]|uniref:GxxExxY protein n=1 Tax=Kaistella daneshvariae TaxID=2487074 RepID=A0ABM7C8R6_9FLAO|nr:GxxExxY protein [Kaistella daneshvariae]AZI67375.1 GxxExxY protein [Kaistella daneshvariae]
MSENEISKIVFESGLKVHRKLGIGLFESVYEECLAYELKKAGLTCDRQRDIAIEYDDLVIKKAFRLDLLIEEKVIIEIKAVPEINNYHTSQLLNYLRLTGFKLGMLLNFHSFLFKDGVKRIANNL